MKYLLILSLTLFSAGSFAKSKEHKKFDKKLEKMSFEEAKDWKLKTIERKTTMLDDEKKCVNDAKDKAMLKKCMSQKWDDKESMKAEVDTDKKQTEDNKKL